MLFRCRLECELPLSDYERGSDPCSVPTREGRENKLYPDLQDRCVSPLFFFIFCMSNLFYFTLLGINVHYVNRYVF